MGNFKNHLGDFFTPIYWNEEENHLELINQLLLPAEEKWVICKTSAQTAQAIKDMIVRGAPAIGITAAYGMAQAAREGLSFEEARNMFAKTRPTAVNLFWALEKASKVSWSFEAQLELAKQIHLEDYKMNLKIAENGANWLISHWQKSSNLEKDTLTVLTHCNTGALATGGWGTALGIIRTLHKKLEKLGKKLVVFANETRPYLQGARLTCWELAKENIEHYLITDNMDAFFMKQIDAILVGADRIARNGDTANKIGTFQVAIVAKHFSKPFLVVAPTTSIDFSIESGEDIPIEMRSENEVKFVRLAGNSVQIAPVETPAKHPAFDVTPAELITAIVTEKGVVAPRDVPTLET